MKKKKIENQKDLMKSGKFSSTTLIENNIVPISPLWNKQIQSSSGKSIDIIPANPTPSKLLIFRIQGTVESLSPSDDDDIQIQSLVLSFGLLIVGYPSFVINQKFMQIVLSNILKDFNLSKVCNAKICETGSENGSLLHDIKLDYKSTSVSRSNLSIPLDIINKIIENKKLDNRIQIISFAKRETINEYFQANEGVDDMSNTQFEYFIPHHITFIENNKIKKDIMVDDVENIEEKNLIKLPTYLIIGEPINSVKDIQFNNKKIKEPYRDVVISTSWLSELNLQVGLNLK